MLADRGVGVDHVSLCRWVQRFAPELAKRLRRHLRPCRGPWHVDETYLRLGGRWCCPHRAADRNGDLVDVPLSERRDPKAARAFFRLAEAVTGVTPAQVTSDGHDSCLGAIRSELGKRVRHRTGGLPERSPRAGPPPRQGPVPAHARLRVRHFSRPVLSRP